MNIFHKIAIRGMFKSRTRTIVTVTGVVLSAAMITAVTSFGFSLLDYLARGAEKKYGGWHAGFYEADASFVQEQSQNGETEDLAVFENIGYAKLPGSKNPLKPYLFIAGFEDETFQKLPVRLIRGRMPADSGELLVSASIAANGGVSIQPGDTLTLAPGKRMADSRPLTGHDPYREGETLACGQERTYTVTGICQRPRFEEPSAPGYTVITKTESVSEADSLSLFVSLKNPRRAETYAKEAAGKGSYTLNENVLRFMGGYGDRLFQMLMYAVGGIVIIIIMTGSVFLIYHSFYISMNERMHQSGILLSAGATQRQLRDCVLFEGLCTGVLGIPIGILAGLGGIRIVIGVVSDNFRNILYEGVPLTLKVSAPAIAVSALVALVTILISACIPAVKAARTPVMECIRQTNDVRVDAGKIRTPGFICRIYGLEGMLALKNFKRNRRRCRGIVLSLVLSVVLFVAASGFVLDLKQASSMAALSATYDIGIFVHEMEDSRMLELYERLKTVEGVDSSLYQEVISCSVTVQAEDCSAALREALKLYGPKQTAQLSVDVQFLEEGAYREKVKEAGLSVEKYTGQNAELIAIAKLPDHSPQGKETGAYVDMFSRKSMKLSLVSEAVNPGKPVTVKTVFTEITGEDMLAGSGRAAGHNPGYFVIMAPWSVKETLTDGHTRTSSKGMTFCSETSSVTARRMEEMILGAGVTETYEMIQTDKITEENNNMIFIANVFAYTFIILISLIAAANVFNTVSTNIRLRRRELAMLRSVGMGDLAFRRMMNFECLFYGIQALAYGLPIAAAACLLIHQGMYDAGADQIRFVLPWAGIGISIFSVLFIVFVTMLYSVSKIRKENIIDALRDDLE